MHPNLNPLTRWQRQTLTVSAALLAATGALWLVLHYGIGGPMEGLPHPAEAWTMRVHGAGVFASLFALGMLAANHIPKGWRIAHGRRGRALRQQYRSGLALCVLAALLIASGYALYYLVTEAARPALGWAHAALGFAMTALGLWHRAQRAHRMAGHAAHHHNPP